MFEYYHPLLIDIKTYINPNSDVNGSLVRFDFAAAGATDGSTHEFGSVIYVKCVQGVAQE